MSALPVRTTERDQLFFGALKKGHSILAACAIAGYARRSVYRWREDDADFEMRWDMALGQALIEIETHIRHHAIEGHEETLLHKGFEVGIRRKWNTGMLMRLWKAAAPDPHGHKEIAHRDREAARAKLAALKREARVPAASPIMQTRNESVPHEKRRALMESAAALQAA